MLFQHGEEFAQTLFGECRIGPFGIAYLYDEIIRAIRLIRRSRIRHARQAPIQSRCQLCQRGRQRVNQTGRHDDHILCHIDRR